MVRFSRTAVIRAVLAFTTGLLLAFGAAQSAQGQEGNPLFKYRLPAEAIPALNAILPPLPDSMPTEQGWSRVVLVESPTCGMRVAPGELDGCTSYSTRTIEIARREVLANRWHTLLHELAHLMFRDTQTVVGSYMAEEQMCDMIATWHLMTRLALTLH